MSRLSRSSINGRIDAARGPPAITTRIVIAGLMLGASDARISSRRAEVCCVA
jgi:hypothetical protein